MALPANRTPTTIVTEALKQAGKKEPGTTLITRAIDEFLRLSLQKLQKKRRWGLLAERKTSVLTAFQNRYSLPTDFLNLKSLWLFSGSHKDTLQAADSSSLTFAADEDITEDAAKNPVIIVTGAVGKKGLMTNIVAYDDTTKVATVSPVYTVSPAGTEDYMIIDFERKLKLIHGTSPVNFVPNQVPTGYLITDIPKELFLNAKVDDTRVFVMMMEYFVDVNKLDTSDVRLTSIYNEFEAVLIQLVKIFYLKDTDQTRKARDEETELKRLYKDLSLQDVTQKLEGSHGFFVSAGGMPNIV